MEVSLEQLVEQGWDISDKYAFASRENDLVPNEDDDE